MLCPFCKEEIIDGAIKCKHCGSMLNSPEPVANQNKKEKAEYSAYSQVPWYRKLWFFNLATFLFWPAAVYVLLTGNVYFVKNGKVRPIGVINKIFVFLWAAIFTYLIITSVLGIGGGSTYVNMVKEGNYKDYPNIEIGKAFENFFSNPKWKHFTSDDGENVVEFNGDFMYADKEAKAKIQYVVGDGSFRVATFAINGETQNDMMYATLMEKVFESSKTTEAESTAGDEKALLLTAMGDLKALMTAIEVYITDEGAAPPAASIDELSKLESFVPKYIKNVPLKDPWGNSFYYEGGSHEDLYIISSIGPDKTKGTDDDIIYSNGVLEKKYPDLTKVEEASTEPLSNTNASQVTEQTPPSSANNESNAVATSDISGNYVSENDNSVTIKQLDERRIKFNILTSTAEGCTGEIDGVAELINNVATFNDEKGCKLRLEFSKDSITVMEENCSDYHGEQCGFGGEYKKK